MPSATAARKFLTKPGKDRFRGQIFYNYGNAIFNSRNPYAQEKPPFDLNDIGGNLGGPLGKNASFFLDVDQRDINNGAVINAITLDPMTLAIVSPFTEVYSAPQTRWRISPRIDYQFGAKNTLTFRYAISKNSTSGNGIGRLQSARRAGTTQSNLEHAFQATETAVLSSKVVDESPLSVSASALEPGLARSRSVHHRVQCLQWRRPRQRHVPIHPSSLRVSELSDHVEGAHAWKMGIRVRAVSIQDTSTR